MKTDGDNKKTAEDVENTVTINQPEKEKEEITDQDNEVKNSSPKKSKKTNTKKLDELKNKYEEVNDKYLRLSAEFDNYRKRTLKEKMELTKSAGESLLVNILPVMDDFERALDNIEKAKDLTAMKEGIALIHNKFREFLKQNGVEEIISKDQDFDTDIHEAITKFPVESDEQKGKVIDVVQKGYMLNDKVIRFAKVVVGE